MSNSPAINGIQVEIKNGSDVETPVFATTRRCPDLLSRLKAIRRADVAETAASRAHELAIDKLNTAANAEDIKGAQKEAEKTSDKVAEASEKALAAIHDFMVTGFRGAGYSPEEAEKYAGMIEVERVQELTAKAMFGAGRVGFPKG